jgi:hypothetical protein
VVVETVRVGAAIGIFQSAALFVEQLRRPVKRFCSGRRLNADHTIVWKTRRTLKLDTRTRGSHRGPRDNLILDIQNGMSADGFGHPRCKGGQSC